MYEMAAERFRTIVRIVASELDKRKVKALNKAVSVIDNAGGKIQSRLNNAQSRLSSKYELVAKKIAAGESTTFGDWRSRRRVENQAWSAAAAAGIVRWWDWYQRLVGLDRLEVCKQQVDSAQERLFNCQSGRRCLNKEATIQNEKLKEVYAELLQTKRDDPRYVQLTILENKSLQDLRKIVGELNLLEKEERDHFTMLATAIKEYHVTQDMCAQKYKYISIVASISLAIVSFLASIVYNNQRTESGRMMLSESLGQNKQAQASTIRSMEEYLNAHLSQILNKLADLEKKTDRSLANDLSNETSSRNLISEKTYAAIGLGISGVLLLKALFY